MKKLKKFICICFSLLLICFGMSVKGDQYKQANSFSISPLSPETNKPQSSYYNLKVKPLEEKKIKVRIFNSEDKEIEVDVATNDAITNDNGVISYAGDGENDTSLKIPFSSIATLKATRIKIPKQGSADAEILIKMPKEEYEGVILGGIRVTGAAQNNSEEEKKDVPAVSANIAYSVAVLLTEKEEEINPNIHLLDIVKENRNYRNAISAQLQNSAPRLVKDLEVHAKVYKKGSSGVLYEAQKSEMQMAPNSRFKFGVSLEETSIKAGEYTMKITGKADGHHFSFSRDFNVTKEEARTLNKNAVYVSDQPDNTLLYIFISIFLGLIALILIYLVYKKRKVYK